MARAQTQSAGLRPTRGMVSARGPADTDYFNQKNLEVAPDAVKTETPPPGTVGMRNVPAENFDSVTSGLGTVSEGGGTDSAPGPDPNGPAGDPAAAGRGISAVGAGMTAAGIATGNMDVARAGMAASKTGGITSGVAQGPLGTISALAATGLLGPQAKGISFAYGLLNSVFGSPSVQAPTDESVAESARLSAAEARAADAEAEAAREAETGQVSSTAASMAGAQADAANAAADAEAAAAANEANTGQVGTAEANAAGEASGGPDAGGDPSGHDGSDGSSGGQGFATGGMVGLVPRYADGGQIGGGPLLALGFADGGQIPSGAPGLTAGGPGATMDPKMIDMRVNELLRNPQVVQRLVAGVQQYIQSGELTEDEVVTMGQIAEAALQNPAIYPQLRAFVVQQGMTALPAAYDPIKIMKILAISRAVQKAGGVPPMQPQGQELPAGQIPPTSQAQMVNPTGAPQGGMLQGPGTGTSDSIGTKNMSTGGPVSVSNGEYVIPAHVVRAKGRDFFDTMLRRYADVSQPGSAA